MLCNAIQVTAPNKWHWGLADIGEPKPEETTVRVEFSSLCGTDKDIVDGSLCYYQSGEAKFPIITGHEWCGHTVDGPVTGLCILPHRERVEVGVVNRNGAHADCIIMPKSGLIPIPKVDPMYALVEPTAVVLHGLGRIDLGDFQNIAITGYGTLGRICSDILRVMGRRCVIYDPDYGVLAGGTSQGKNTGRGMAELCWKAFDLVIECSGNINSLAENISEKGGTVLGFGFDYKQTLGELVSNEVTFVGTLGSTKEDFVRAVEIMPEITSVDFDMMKIEDFGKALIHSNKVVFDHGGYNVT